MKKTLAEQLLDDARFIGGELTIRDYTKIVANMRKAAAVVSAAQALLEKLDFVAADPKYQSVWVMSANHGVPYTGPTYSYEKQMLSSALTDTL